MNLHEITLYSKKTKTCHERSSVEKSTSKIFVRFIVEKNVPETLNLVKL